MASNPHSSPDGSSLPGHLDSLDQQRHRSCGSLDRDSPTITATGDATFVVKFGRVTSAYLDLEIDGDGGTVVTLLPRETPEQAEPVRPMQVTLQRGETAGENPG